MLINTNIIQIQSTTKSRNKSENKTKITSSKNKFRNKTGIDLKTEKESNPETNHYTNLEENP